MLVARQDLDEITDIAKMIQGLNIDTALYLTNKVNNKKTFKFLMRDSSRYNTESLKDTKNYSSLSVNSLIEVLETAQKKIKTVADASPNKKLPDTLDLTKEVVEKNVLKKMSSTKSAIDGIDERAGQKRDEKSKRR